MSRLIVSLLLLVMSNFAFAEDLICDVSVNTEVVAEMNVAVTPQSKTIYYIDNGYVFFVSNRGESKFELEIFDASIPARSYATGYLRSTQDELVWTMWSRDILLETACRLAN